MKLGHVDLPKFKRAVTFGIGDQGGHYLNTLGGPEHELVGHSFLVIT